MFVVYESLDRVKLETGRRSALFVRDEDGISLKGAFAKLKVSEDLSRTLALLSYLGIAYKENPVVKDVLVWFEYGVEFLNYGNPIEELRMANSNSDEVKHLMIDMIQEMDIRECGSKQHMVFMQLFTKYPVGSNREPWDEQLEWRYECFTKTLGVLDDEKGKFISIPLPRKIIFGKNMLEKNKVQILNWIKAKKYDIEIQQMA